MSQEAKMIRQSDSLSLLDLRGLLLR